MKQIFSIIISFFPIIQIYGQVNCTSLKPLLKEVVTYCLSDTINFTSKELFEYNSLHQKIKKDKIIKKGGFFERYKYKYNDFGKITSEDYFRNNYKNYKDSLVLLSTTKYLYDSDNVLVAVGKQKITDKEESWETVEKDSCAKNITDYIIKKDGNNELFYYKNGQLYRENEYHDGVIVTESYYRINQLQKRTLYSYKDKKLTKKYTEYYETLTPDKKERLLEFYKWNIKKADSIGEKKAVEELTTRYKELLINNDQILKMGNYESVEYFYKNGLLVQERKIDNGIDPCFYPCCGKFLIKYKYTE